MTTEDKTHCEKLGYKVGDKFTFKYIEAYPISLANIWEKYADSLHNIVTLSCDDGSDIPMFECQPRRFSFPLSQVEKVSDASTRSTIPFALSNEGVLTEFGRFLAVVPTSCITALLLTKKGFILEFEGYSWESLSEEQVIEKISLLTKLFDFKEKADEQ